MKWIYTLFFCTATLLGVAQCDISDLTATIGGCNADGEFAITLTFMDKDIDSKQYIVQGNGINYGTLMYNNGIIIDGLLGDCTTKFEFVVRDAGNPSCGEAIEVGTVCCGPCDIEAAIKQRSTCDNDGNYDVSFEVGNPPINSSSYTVTYNGTMVGTLDYNDPNQSLSILHDGEDIAEFIICDQANTTCCDTIQITSPCVCSIFNARWDVIDCDDQDSTFSFIFDADFQVVSDSFTIAVNAVNYGNYSYNQLPLVIGPFDWEPIKYDFVIADANNLLCFDFGEPGEIEICPPSCDWSNTSINYTCNADKDLELEIDIDNEGIGVLGYEVVLDGMILDTLYGTDTTYVATISDGSCEGAPTLVLNDLYYSCDTSLTLLDTCCRVPCTITSLIATVDCQTDLLLVEINTDTDPSETFTSTLFYGANSIVVATGTVSDFPLEIDVSTYQNGAYVLDVVIDGDLCSEEVQFGIDCPFDCNLGSVAISSMGCDAGGMALVEIDFTSSDTPSSTFNVEDLNGNIYGPFDYNDGPYLLEVAEDCELAPTFFIEDSVDPLCGTSASLPEPLCCTCDIEFVGISLADCMDGSFEVTLDIRSNTAASSGYDLSGNGINYGTFLYDASPITLSLVGDCVTIYEFLATDSQDGACMASVALDEPICCDVPTCSINIGSAMVEPCIGMTAAVILDIAGTEVSDSFTLVGNGMDYGTYAYGQSPVRIEVAGDCITLYDFVVTDLIDSNCSTATQLTEPICCDTASCEINIDNVEIGQCMDGLVDVAIIVGNDGMASDSFVLTGNGNTYGTYGYNQSPIILTIEPDCELDYEFVATDREDADCSGVFEVVEPICCDTMIPCTVAISDVVISDCADDSVTVSLTIVQTSMRSTSYAVRGNGMDYGVFASDQDIFITVAGDCSTLYEFMVMDISDTMCTDFIELDEPICCDTSNCDLAVVDVLVGDCEDGSYTVTFSVTGEDLGATLLLSQDTITIDALLTSDGTYTVGPIAGGDTITYTVTDPGTGCSDDFTVMQDCLTSIAEIEVPKTTIYSINNTITWRSETTWWTAAYIYTIDGQRVAQLGSVSEVVVRHGGIYIVELRNESQRIVEKVLVTD